MAYSGASVPGSPAVRPAWVGGLRLLGVLVALMWVLEIIDVPLQGRLDLMGIRARDTDGLVGIAFAPFLHGGFGHLIANTLPLVVLGALIAFDGAARLAAVSVVTGLVSGLGAWMFSPSNSVTVGASGLVFGYAAYLIVRGVFNKKLWQLAVGIGVVVIWGSALLSGIMPQSNGISWQGHLFGAIGGVLVAWMLARDAPRPR